jgi:hypothetical protein
MELQNLEQGLPEKKINFVLEGLKIGVVNGIIALILMYASYYAGMDAFVNMQFYTRFIPYMALILVLYGFQLRKKNGGYLSFKEAIQFTFMSYVIAGVVIGIGTYILFNLVDPNLTRKSFDVATEKLKKMTAGSGDQDKLNEQIRKLREGSTETGVKDIFLGTGIGWIWDFVVSAIISFIIRKEKPAI